MLILNDALWATIQYSHFEDQETETRGGEIYDGHIEHIYGNHSQVLDSKFKILSIPRKI